VEVKSDIEYTEYGRTVIKKGKSSTIRLNDADYGSLE